MGGMEAVITGLSDDFKILKRNRKIFTFATAFGTFLVAILCVTNVSLLGLCHLILNQHYVWAASQYENTPVDICF